ncbi:MAG: hypothetical protein H6582_04680 [Crocinitomicaceae bacterium]|nr:hypothetical protein [Crocinitomicaceae bacterium]
MARVHAFEFEDLSWFPKRIRDYGTDFLQFVTNKFDFYKGIAPLLSEALNKTGQNEIIDLASGGGGGWKSLARHLKEENPSLKITLTDYYPNLNAFNNAKEEDPELYSFVEESVDARNVPVHLNGFRTQFLSFHHFKPEDALKILQNAVDNNAGIGIFEGQKRDVPHFIKNLLSPVSIIIATPFIRPFKAGRILFTYILPIVPLFVLWDGVISVLRTYSVKEMEDLVQKVNGSESYEWKIGLNKTKGITVPYLIGYPKS